MTGYARQSSSSIQDGETITAAPLNSEFDAILAAFAFSGGHNHDGTSTEGAYVGLIADVDALNKIVVDTSNNRHGFFVEVSSSAVEQIRVQDGAIVPVTDSDIDLGTSSLEFKDLYIDGTAYVDTLEIHVGATLSAGVLSLPDGSASAPVITNTGDTNQGLYFSGTDEMSFTAGGTAQVTFADGAIKPVTDNDIDLGTSSLEFKNLYIDGTANIDTLAATTMSGDLAMGSNKVTGLAAPTADGDAARKAYVDDSISTAEGLTQLAGNINVNGFHFFGSSGEDIKFKPVGSASLLATQDNDGEFVALVLRNESDAADTTGIASLRFDLEDTGGNTVDAAKIAVKKEQSFTATASTQDAKIVFSTSLNGTLTEYLELSSAGALVPVTDNTVDIGTSSKEIKDIYVDGTAYIDAIGFGSTSMTLPTSDGSANQILKTDGSGTLSFADDTGTTINNATENELVTVASTTTQLDGEANLTFDGTTLTLNGKLAMASNTAGKLLIADGTDFEPTAVGDLSEISSIANDDVLLAVDTSGGGLKKVARSTLVSGLATSSAISNVVEDTTPQLGGDLDAQGKDVTDVGILFADASAGIYGPTGSPVVFTVTVASKTSAHPYNGDGSSSGYFLNGVESPAIQLHGADSVTSSTEYFYKFDQADSSNSGHPLRFYLDAAKTIAYTTGVTTSGTPGTAGAHTTIAVTDQTPSTLYYQCSSHAYMGNYAVVASSANITSSGAVSIDAVGDVTLDADGGDILFKDAGTTFGSATNTSGDLILKSGTTTAVTFDGANATAAGNLAVTGNLTVNGTTTTVNSTTVTIDDPIFTLGGDSAPSSDDNKDRGIEFRYHTGSAAKVGFFGYDDSAGAFTFIPDASNSSEVFSGTAGNVAFGNIAGTLTTAAQTNITSVGALDGGSITSGFGTIDTGSSNITTTGLISGGSLDIDNVLINGTTIGHTDDTDLMTLSNGGLVVAGTLEATGNITGTLATAAQTNITSLGTLTTLTVDNVIINGTTIGHTDDTDLMTLASGGLTVAGTIEGTTITASTAVVPDASGGADLGSTSLEWGDLYIADDKKIYLGSDQNFSIEYDEDGNDTTAVVAANGVSFAPHGSGTGNTTELRFQELAANGANYVGFKAPDSISSNEVWVLPNADGTADQVLKTDGSNNLSWGSAGGGETFTASGAILDKSFVAITTDGNAKVEAVFNKRNASRLAADENDWYSNASDPAKFSGDFSTSGKHVVYDPDTDRVILLHTNNSVDLVSQVGTVTSGTVGGETNRVSDIAWGGEQDVETGYHGANGSCIAYDTTNNKIVAFFRDETNSERLAAKVGTVTGGTTNTISWGSAVSVGDDHNVEYVSATFVTHRGKFLVAYQGENSYLKAVSFTVSGTGGSFGTVADITDAATTHIDVAYNSVLQQSAVAYTGASNYGYIKGLIMAADGSITGGNNNQQVTFSSATTKYINVTANPNTTNSSSNSNTTVKNDEYLLTYYGASNYLYAIILTQRVDGEVSSTGATTLYNSGDVKGNSCSFDVSTGRFTVMFVKAHSSSTLAGEEVELSPSTITQINNDLSPGTTSQSVTYVDTCYDPDTENTICVFTYTLSGVYKGASFGIQGGKSNNHSNFIGVAANAASDGESVLVKSTGQVAELNANASSNSDMTVGNIVYLENDATSSATQTDAAWISATVKATNSVDNALIGRVISSTKIMLGGNFTGAGHDDNTQVDD